MNDCDAMLDRMAAVASGSDSWSASDAAHLLGCIDCRASWRVISHGASLGSAVEVDAERIADVVVQRLRAAAPVTRPIRRLPWRGAIGAAVAIAASVALIFSVPHVPTRRAVGGTDSAATMAILPELQRLDDRDLQSVKDAMGAAASDATPGTLPHLGDLTEGELEQLLHSEGGQ